jgi:NAD(P) transhydrogenase subunit alpha
VSESVVWLTIFILSVFVGVEVISKVSSTLHTPLMSGANAIHGIILLGAILVSGYAEDTLQLVVGLVAVVLASVNMVGGFVVTDRMLQMFTRKRPAAAGTPADRAAPKRRFGVRTRTSSGRRAPGRKPGAAA